MYLQDKGTLHGFTLVRSLCKQNEARQHVHAQSSMIPFFFLRKPKVHLIAAVFQLASFSCYQLLPCMCLLFSRLKLPCNLPHVYKHDISGPNMMRSCTNLYDDVQQVYSYLSGLKTRFLYANHCKEKQEPHDSSLEPKKKKKILYFPPHYINNKFYIFI